MTQKDMKHNILLWFCILIQSLIYGRFLSLLVRNKSDFNNHYFYSSLFIQTISCSCLSKTTMDNWNTHLLFLFANYRKSGICDCAEILILVPSPFPFLEHGFLSILPHVTFPFLQELGQSTQGLAITKHSSDPNYLKSDSILTNVIRCLQYDRHGTIPG